MHNDKRLTTYLLILLSLAILIFFTKSAYSELQIQLSEKRANEQKVQELNVKKENLSKIQKSMNDPESSTRQEIARYINDFSEEDMLGYFYSYAKSTDGKFIIQSLNLDKKDINEYGFKEWTVILNVSAENQRVVLDFLRSILSESAQYRFFIEKFDMPEKKEWLYLDVVIPLKVFYK